MLFDSNLLLHYESSLLYTVICETETGKWTQNIHQRVSIREKKRRCERKICGNKLVDTANKWCNWTQLGFGHFWWDQEHTMHNCDTFLSYAINVLILMLICVYLGPFWVERIVQIYESCGLVEKGQSKRRKEHIERAYKSIWMVSTMCTIEEKYPKKVDQSRGKFYFFLVKFSCRMHIFWPRFA